MTERPEISLLRRLHARIERGGLAAINPDEYDRAFQLLALSHDLDTAATRGLDDYHRWRTEDLGTFEISDIQLVEIVDLGDDALVHTRNLQRGRGSGIDLRIEVWTRWSFAEGRARRAAMYRTRAEAEADPGLGE